VWLGGVLAALLVGAGSCVLERARLGASLDDARLRIEADVQGQFTTLSDRLERAVNLVAADPALLLVVQTRDGAGTHSLFVRTADAAALADFEGVAITVYGLDGRPIAWAGRPSPIPIPRLSGPETFFLAPVSPLGLRLVRVKPIVLPADSERRAGTIVAEAPLPASGGSPEQVDEGFVLRTSVAPVPLRTRFEGAPDTRDRGILIRSVNGEPLAVADVPASEIDAAHARWRAGTVAAEMGVLVTVLLLLTGPLLDRRRLRGEVWGHLAFTFVVLALLVAARALLYVAVRLAGLDRPSLASSELAGNYWWALDSPLDFLFTTLFIGGVVGLAASSFEQWRHSRRMRVRVIGPRSIGRAIGFVAAQLAAGAAVGGLVIAYESFIRTRLSQASVDILHFSLHPLDWARLPVVVGLVILHAALLALFVLIFRFAMSRWVVAGNRRWIRGVIPLLWAVAAIATIRIAMASWERPPIPPAIVVLAAAMAAAWRLRRFRARLAHASQAARLSALFLAVVLPSLAFYPSLVDAAGRSRRLLVETRYAPEVMNQRRNLLLQLQEATAQIDAISDLASLVSATPPVVSGAPPTEPAFSVWRRTVLGDLRLTSSVELYDEAGALVSRFALKLPESVGAQPWQEGSCDWEVFGEVSPFFAEERRLLHADTGVCVPDATGALTTVGSVILHVQLDYSNLSFISAQSPYVALLRAEAPTVDLSSRERLEFAVYGWSRRVLYMSGVDAWPLDESVFPRIRGSRDPFWAQVRRGETEYDVYFLNDRGAIYALGYPRVSVLGHLVNLAELVVLSAATMLLLLAAGVLYGLIATRTPTSGRALLREVRASFYRKLFIAFVIAAVLPVMALALLSREYMLNLINADVENEATRTAASASRVVEDVGTLEVRGGSNLEVVDDNLVVWLSRVTAQDVNIFDGAGLLASSERALFASGILPVRTPGDVYRAIVLEGRPSFVYRETVAGYQYLVSAAPVRVQNRPAILTVPLTLRQREVQAQIDELDRRVLLAAVLFILLGAAIGYWMAERIADPVNRLTKATARIAKGDLDARILATSSDEFRRLVDAFNRMAADLLRQRAELARTNRLAAWADMARQVAHDIKNPLTPIQLNAEHLRRVHVDRGEPLGAVLEECVSNILAQVRLLRQLASEFSSFASSPTPKPTATALADLMDDVVAPYRTGLAGRVAIDLDVPPTLPPLLVDKTLLARAVTNVIENALHAMPNGGTLRVLARSLSDGHLQLLISDTGIGMDRDALARIFEPYFSTRAAGTGLGLTIAKRNVELNNGSIEVASEKGKGTTVTLTLPMAA
jgi:signal transduction histidine kinase